MTETEIMTETRQGQIRFAAVKHFAGTVVRLLLNPGKFYEERREEKGYRNAVFFLLTVSILFTLSATLMMVEKNGIFALIFLLNAFLMPFFTAFVLYLAAGLFCRGTFSYEGLFRITAYANVSLLIAWIPGIAWVSGIWKFYLIGVGMVRTGGIKGRVAFACLLTAAVLLLLAIHLLKPVLSS